MTTADSPLMTELDGETLVLRPHGNLVASTVESVRTAIAQALARMPEGVVLDLAEVEQLDSLGITLVLGVFKTCQKAGKAFRVQGVRPDLMRVFRLFNLSKFFPVAEA